MQWATTWVSLFLATLSLENKFKGSSRWEMCADVAEINMQGTVK
ncbi:hypothetical protein GWE_05000 [Chlamydia psittaci NJ1]|nr:hypothetical protein B712_0251 [Chlamydia psittaci NJ1]KPZ36630.1 hypothetical protein GWE_05000 [Chlamydia psittaci NJ1]